jgi:hypothetical protein
MTQRVHGVEILGMTQEVVRLRNAPSRLGRWNHGVLECWRIWLDWNSGFDDAEAVRDKGAIG